MYKLNDLHIENMCTLVKTEEETQKNNIYK